MPKKRKFSLTQELKKLNSAAPKVTAKARKKLRELFASGAEVGGQQPSCWPWSSYSLGVHPSQVKEANALQKAAGTGCHHDPKTGKLVAPDAASRKRAIKLRGRTDLSAFN